MILILLLSTMLSWSSQHGHHASTSAHHPRSMAAKHQFWRQTGHPHGWKGHVVDHRIPLACGGEDSPRNMAWQTVAEGQAKDRWERKDCSIYHGKTHP